MTSFINESLIVHLYRVFVYKHVFSKTSQTVNVRKIPETFSNCNCSKMEWIWKADSGIILEDDDNESIGE